MRDAAKLGAFGIFIAIMLAIWQKLPEPGSCPVVVCPCHGGKACACSKCKCHDDGDCQCDKHKKKRPLRRGETGDVDSEVPGP
jgi:hypothetical protein